MTNAEAQAKLNQRFEEIASATDKMHSNLIANARTAFSKKYGREMSAGKEAILKNSIQQMDIIMQSRGVSKAIIASAVADISNVANPIAMLYNLMSILIPNFAYTEVLGLQPLPTKESPIFFPQITANDNRNNVTKGTKLLGESNWETGNNYTTNQINDAEVTGKTGTQIKLTTGGATAGSGVKIEKGSCVVTAIIDEATYVLVDNYEGGFTGGIDVTNGPITAASYADDTVTLTLKTADTGSNKYFLSYRYDWGATDAADSTAYRQKPAQITLEFESKSIKSHPYRLRSTYMIENMLAAKKVLAGYDIDQVLASTLGGYINKEISGNVFNDMLVRTDGTINWNAVAPTGVPQAQHNLMVLQPFVEAKYDIRDNVKRSVGNWAVVGTDWIKKLEMLGTNVFGESNWKPQNYGENVPIGPYVAGTINGMKVLYNQDFDASVGVVGYRRDDTDASMVGGVFIGLYSTNPIAKDDLNVVQGMGTQFAYRKILPNSLIELSMVNAAESAGITVSGSITNTANAGTGWASTLLGS